jgi:hypothetical protein
MIRTTRCEAAAHRILAHHLIHIGSAAILPGFDWPSGIAVIIGCLSLNQVGFLVGAHFWNKPPIQHASDVGTRSPKSTKGR